MSVFLDRKKRGVMEETLVEGIIYFLLHIDYGGGGNTTITLLQCSRCAQWRPQPDCGWVR